MNEAIESRELITLNGLGTPLQGTYHRATDRTPTSRREPGERNCIGVLFLNTLFLPRTATGDAAVYWAEAFAACGHPSFRVDLPGLGDSDAPLNTALLDFINAGGYEAITSAIVKELVERFNLSGLVIVGQCAGAISALFAAAASKECKGLVILDPYFFLPQQMKKSRAWKRLVRWASTSRLGGTLSNTYDWLKNLRLALRGNSPPGNANFALLKRWTDVASKGTPILLFKAPGRKSQGVKPRVGEFDYIAYILAKAGRKSQVVVQLVDGTDHSFANQIGKIAVRRHAEVWLNTHFPSTKTENSTPSLSAPIAHDYENHAQCL
jgi:pimeloyl-ACP methyl ester carboxylesterase